MNAAGVNAAAVRPEIGEELHRLVADLYPICRSITGDGVRETLRRIAEIIPLEQHEVPTGTQAFDWTVPREWNIRDAYVKDRHGRRVIDFAASNLHVVGLQHSRRCANDARRAEGAPVHDPRAARLGPAPDLLLPRDLGLLPQPQRPARAGGRGLRSPHRQHARGRPPHLRRVLPPGRAGGRGARLDAHLPSVARKRQPLRHRGRDVASRGRWRSCPAGSPTASSSLPARSARSSG